MLGCERAAEPPVSPVHVEAPEVQSTWWLDVSARGRRYYGLVTTTSRDGQLWRASGVVVYPWYDRPDVSVLAHRTHNGDTTTQIKVGQKTHPLPERSLVLVDTSGTPTEVRRELPLEAYQSRAKLIAVVAQALEESDAERKPG